ncbi:DNA mismatch repair protein MutS [Clostridium algidicarnis]|uniref:DNA mismatch repair protein MutS n=2 Tax=Clostridium algidicarnis TaxID=37659 RepID=A0A2S6FY65_9CLOT|nr:DNA mismatch repair protein MutS [Clostridium algidicarnis]MBB6630165.1 DNA mismatch repair protein MutS [Clostridium algidicarnis]MBB6697527.1 DNA mismatch repair protein MutS [Clostridium algidicarnis]MBU3220125.1 DNA mismatch repair protein MutS [Clostridium algidicarnis]PPK48419.1 DNA mismatch repair protein MutS [Clostridium algidicarnis DSM 15099]
MALTPMMQQYFEIKERYKDCILFFRLGDFYEMFFEDAKLASRELELVLTGRDCGLEEKAPMCGIPYHASKAYIGRLIVKGYKVAICEQTEDPAEAKGIVKRDVIKVITPGTFNDSSFIDENKNNYIMSIYGDHKNISLSISDISTGEFFSTVFSLNYDLVIDELSKFRPKEIIICEDIEESLDVKTNIFNNIVITKKPINYFTNNSYENVKLQFPNNKTSLQEEIVFSASGLLNYIMDTQKQSLSNITSLEVYDVYEFMSIDVNSRRNLELTENIMDKSKKGSLLGILDNTNTAMGSRMLRRWIEQPLISKVLINYRLDGVDELYKNLRLLDDIKYSLKDIYDIERIIGKISNKNVNAKELLSLKASLKKLPDIKRLLKDSKSNILKDISNNIDELEDVYNLIDDSIIETPSLSLKEGNLIKEGFNSKIDGFKEAKSKGKMWIASMESKEREFTGIKSLKIGYNKVFGYYIEITKTHYDSIPKDRYIRKQTLSNAERFITQELKEIEDQILGAEENLIDLEYKLFVDIRDKIENHVERMKTTARHISTIDCLYSLTNVALDNNYVRPIINDEDYINIKEGRHAVVEKVIEKGRFVSNDTYMNTNDDQLLLITGPNMAGKSTYMRQIAVIVLMAQIGSFVPADYADISICDKIFTRIGASDDLAGGKSTFMVEMCEVSNILKNATSKSLILLDEVGRGTSTYDGLSIAWSVIEYICTNKNLRSKTLFATHYHELTVLEDSLKGVKNYSVSVKEIDNSIVFLRKILPKGADESYGIDVAKLAGLPKEVINRARDILLSLEKDSKSKRISKEKHLDNKKDLDGEKILDNEKNLKSNSNNELEINENIDKEDPLKINKDLIKEDSHQPLDKKDIYQIGFKDLKKENFMADISEIDILNMTPLDCMVKLNELVKKAKDID